jgi:hypothetical protein
VTINAFRCHIACVCPVPRTLLLDIWLATRTAMCDTSFKRTSEASEQISVQLKHNIPLNLRLQ